MDPSNFNDPLFDTPGALWDARLAPAMCGGPRRHRDGSTWCCPPAMVRLGTVAASRWRWWSARTPD